MQKPSLPRGTRDFGPDQMSKRLFLLDTIRQTFRRYGFQPLETPAIENLSVLMGKYGEEGDQLLFKILNSGNFANKLISEDLTSSDSQSAQLALKIAEKGLRYDLTVPFARYVVMNRHALAMPFKRYQIQPVWRADRPQKGRYREFVQCDADVVGTVSLLCEAEIVLMLHEIFENLGLSDFTIKINNRKILTGITETIGAIGQEGVLAVAIDKLDKIGQENVIEELRQRGFHHDSIRRLEPIFSFPNNAVFAFEQLKAWLVTSEVGRKGVEELEEVWCLIGQYGLKEPRIQLDITLARGLSYYTGAIFEVKADTVQIGSISGGGRYDNLTGAFGMPGLSGVGISLGVDRIYDVMEELALFPDFANQTTKVLVVHLDEESRSVGLPLLHQLRFNNIPAEAYPEITKLKKQLDYANQKQIPYVVLIGSEERQSGQLTLKNMVSGVQIKLEAAEIIQNVKQESH